MYNQAGGDSSYTRLGGIQLVALALPEACCHFGIGKVYFFPKPEMINIGDSTMPDYAKFAYLSFPELIYIPHHWAAVEKSDWLVMRHLDRLSLLDARGGMISTKFAVMPIGLTYHAAEPQIIRFNGLNSATEGSRAILIIAPRAYLGWTDSMSQGAKMVLLQHMGNHAEFLSPAWDCDINHLESNHRLPDSSAVVKCLHDMYRSGEPRSLCFLHEILTGMRNFHAELVKAGGAQPEDF